MNERRGFELGSERVNYSQFILSPDQLAEMPRIGYPKSYQFENTNGALLFFGANHSYLASDEQFQRLDESLSSFSPDLILVEGEDHLDSKRREELAALVSQTPVAQLVAQGTERYFALRHALAHGIPYDSPEPTLAETLDMLEAVDITRNDIFCYMLVRTIPKWHALRTQGANLSLEEYLQGTRDLLATQSGWSDFDFSLSQFERHMEAITGLTHEEWLVKSRELSDPIVRHGVGSPLNNVAQQTSYFRNTRIVDMVSRRMHDYKKIMIVYGATHAWATEPAFQKMYEERST